MKDESYITVSCPATARVPLEEDTRLVRHFGSFRVLLFSESRSLLIIKLVLIVILAFIGTRLFPARSVSIFGAALLAASWLLFPHFARRLHVLAARLRFTLGQIIGLAATLILGIAAFELLIGYQIVLAELGELAQAGLLDPYVAEGIQSAQLHFSRLQIVLPLLWLAVVGVWLLPRFRLRKILTFPLSVLILVPTRIPNILVFAEAELTAAFTLSIVSAVVWSIGWILDLKNSSLNLAGYVSRMTNITNVSKPFH